LPSNWQTELNRLVIIVLTAVTVGWLVNQVLLSVLIAITAYLFYFLYQLKRLNNWLVTLTLVEDAEPPESSGLWGAIFDGIFRLQQGKKAALANLYFTLQRAQRSADALNMAIVLLDKNDSLEWWNSAAEKLLGFRKSSDEGQAITNLIRHPLFIAYYAEENYQQPLTLASPANSNTMLEFQIIMFGEKERLIVARDITQIERLGLMRKDFIANVSHELRTPITVISGYLETLIDNAELSDPRWSKAIDQMYQQSRRVENIVRDLLMLSRLETRAINLQQNAINLSALLAEIQRDTADVISEYKHELVLECDPELSINGERQEIYSAISNLVLNAAKYTPEAGKIRICCEQSPEEITIAVIDNGIGIASEHIPRITERFYRVDVSRSKNTGGTGLGLAIVKHILVRHNANLEIASELGKGSCFKCRFPKPRAGHHSQPGRQTQQLS